ncbi:Jacalin-related lectin 2 [Carex littledalei]|uniref:Jacalin-related lectin 2 n=1 Tax=Carex littledalei TaxID=544730 RepID=A0A833QNZ9_9POAL|nr:Jacalin-related lectin 2 [Carex littledalei]
MCACEKDIPIKLGPCGFKDCGVAWDDGAHQKIEKIVISYTDYFINSIQAVYRDGENNLITVTNPIMRIEGCTGYHSGPGINFLQFFSNVGSYGSFGRNIVQGASGNFKFESDVGITGFHGTCHSGRLHSLGVYISSSAKKHLANSSK